MSAFEAVTVQLEIQLNSPMHVHSYTTRSLANVWKSLSSLRQAIMQKSTANYCKAQNDTYGACILKLFIAWNSINFIHFVKLQGPGWMPVKVTMRLVIGQPHSFRQSRRGPKLFLGDPKVHKSGWNCLNFAISSKLRHYKLFVLEFWKKSNCIKSFNFQFGWGRLPTKMN